MAIRDGEEARLREEEARSGGEGAVTAAVRRRNEGIDDDDGAEVEGGVALLQLRETATAAAQRMP